jgi:DNA-binding XRE family transcriptional regulator
MKPTKRRKLQERGWKLGSAAEFLDLSEQETAFIELKIAFSESLRQHRARDKLSQVEVARLVGSSQSRVAKMEAGDPTVSLDLLVKSLLALGASRQDLARMISK